MVGDSHQSSCPSSSDEPQQADNTQKPAQLTPEQQHSNRGSVGDVSNQPHHDHATETTAESQEYDFRSGFTALAAYVNQSESLPQESNDPLSVAPGDANLSDFLPGELNDPLSAPTGNVSPSDFLPQEPNDPASVPAGYVSPSELLFQEPSIPTGYVSLPDFLPQDVGDSLPAPSPGYVSPSAFLPLEQSDQNDDLSDEAAASGRSKGKEKAAASGKSKGKEKASFKHPRAGSPGSSSAHNGGQGPSKRRRSTGSLSTMDSEPWFFDEQEQEAQSGYLNPLEYFGDIHYPPVPSHLDVPKQQVQPGYLNPLEYQPDMQYPAAPSILGPPQEVLPGSEPWPAGPQGSQLGYPTDLQHLLAEEQAVQPGYPWPAGGQGSQLVYPYQPLYQQGEQYPAGPSYQPFSQAFLGAATGAGPASRPRYYTPTESMLGQCERCKGIGVQCRVDVRDGFSCTQCNELDIPCSIDETQRRRYPCFGCAKRGAPCVGLLKGDCTRCMRRGMVCYYPDRQRPAKCRRCEWKNLGCDKVYGETPCTTCVEFVAEETGREPASVDHREVTCVVQERERMQRCRYCVDSGQERCDRSQGPNCPSCEALGLHCDYLALVPLNRKRNRVIQGFHPDA